MKGDPGVRSRLSTSRFGVAIAHVTLEPGDDVESIPRRARSGDVAMVVIRLDVGELASVMRLEAIGARLCDTLVYWSTTNLVHQVVSEGIREAGPADTDVVETIARLAFVGYRGHFQVDERLDRRAANEVYADWARRTCDGGSDRVWLIDDEGPAGFLTLRTNSPEESEILLNAVLPNRQRRGLYPRLVATALDASARAGLTRCIVSTQLHNLAVQKVWARMGFEPSRALHTFHLWADATT